MHSPHEMEQFNNNLIDNGYFVHCTIQMYVAISFEEQDKKLYA